MTEQLDLEGNVRILELSERQQWILEQIEQAGGLTSDELGALLHARRDKHPADQRCDHCTEDGRSAAVELRGKKLVSFRRATFKWHSRRQTGPATSAQTNHIPY